MQDPAIADVWKTAFRKEFGGVSTRRSLVVDDFGVKYVRKEYTDHLIDCLKQCKYKLTQRDTYDANYAIPLQ